MISPPEVVVVVVDVVRLISVVVVVVVVVEVVVEVDVDVDEVSLIVSLLGSSVSFVTVGGGGGGTVSFFEVSFPSVVSEVSFVDDGDDVSFELVTFVVELLSLVVSVTLLLSSVEFVSVGGELVTFEEVTLSSVEFV